MGEFTFNRVQRRTECNSGRDIFKLMAFWDLLHTLRPVLVTMANDGGFAPTVARLGAGLHFLPSDTSDVAFEILLVGTR